jgi:hypothetical protein
MSRAGGAILLVAGGYVAWYGVWELRVLGGDTGPDPVVDGAARLQSALAAAAEALGWPGLLALLGALLVAAGAWMVWRYRRRADMMDP